MKAYCAKCKEKREVVEGERGKTKRGVPLLKGKCQECGTNVSVFLEESGPETVKRKDPRRRRTRTI